MTTRPTRLVVQHQPARPPAQGERVVISASDVVVVVTITEEGRAEVRVEGDRSLVLLHGDAAVGTDVRGIVADGRYLAPEPHVPTRGVERQLLDAARRLMKDGWALTIRATDPSGRIVTEADVVPERATS